MMNSKLSIEKIEYVLPKTKQTVETVAGVSGFSVDELEQNLGFVEKYVTTDEETALDLAKEAVLKLMKARAISPDELDYIIFAHSGICEDGSIRSPSAKIQSLIKANSAFCFEITNGCNSLNAALHIANNLLNNNQVEINILIVVSDTLTKFVDFSEKNVMHCYMYSDGAAAILVNNYGKSNKLISSALHTDGNYADVSKIKYKIQNGVSKKIVPIINTDISEESKPKLYDALISNYIKVITKCMSSYDLKPSDIKYLFLGQNSKKVLSGVLSHFNYNDAKTLFTGRYLGHVGPLDSIIAFHDSLISGKISSDDYVILAGTGTGFHWGAHLIQV